METKTSRRSDTVKSITNPPEDPILPLHREWMAARVEWFRCVGVGKSGDTDKPECIAAKEREHEALEQMLEMTPTSMAGIAALAHVLWDRAGPGSTPGTEYFDDECEDEECKLMAAIWRAASGRSGLPPSSDRAGWL